MIFKLYDPVTFKPYHTPANEMYKWLLDNVSPNGFRFHSYSKLEIFDEVDALAFKLRFGIK